MPFRVLVSEALAPEGAAILRAEPQISLDERGVLKRDEIVPIIGEYDALMIPDTAIVSDQSRKIVFTVGENNVVQAKPVTLGPIVDGLRVIREGLAATDQVVLDGLANPMVRPGAKVVPQKGEITTAKAK